jgi:DNA-binding NarL/FixJ family response regulator
MGVRAGELDAVSRLLAAADVWCALREPRPHRAALPPAEAARVISSLPLDRDAVRAVLAADRAPGPTFPPLPVDLTERELEVLRLLAAGLTKKQIASELFISPSTVHTHTVHVYAKCEVSTRAGLAMFAMRHGLAAGPP